GGQRLHLRQRAAHPVPAHRLRPRPGPGRHVRAAAGLRQLAAGPVRAGPRRPVRHAGVPAFPRARRGPPPRPPGRARLAAGLDPSRRRTTLARRIGVVFGQRTTLWWDLPLKDSFELIRLLYKVDRRVFAARLDELVATLDLGAFLGTPVRQLSLGQRMRGDLAAALLHAPAILVL